MKRGTPDHPKTLHLAQLLDEPHYCAVGILEMLWHFTARYAPQGDIGKYTDDLIAKRVGWEDDPALLLDGLIAAGWVERVEDGAIRLAIHDWDEHSDEAADKWLAEHGELYWNGTKPRRKSQNARKSKRNRIPESRDKSRDKLRQKSGKVKPLIPIPILIPKPTVGGACEGADQVSDSEPEGDEVYQMLMAEPMLMGMTYAQDLTARKCIAGHEGPIPWKELAAETVMKASLMASLDHPATFWRAQLLRWAGKNGEKKETPAAEKRQTYIPIAEREGE